MPRSIWFKALLLFVALWAPLSQAETGWQPIQETIRKSDKDNRQYQAIRLDNGMVVLLVSDPAGSLNRSRRWWCPLGRWKIPRRTRGWHITLNI